MSLPRRERDRLQRRSDIFHAAERVFAEKGFHGASIEEIARAAEYGTGTVYLYFRDKETLYVELFEEKIRELLEFVTGRVDEETEPWEALRRFIHARMEYFDRNRPFFKMYTRERMDWGWTKEGKWAGAYKLYESYIHLLTRLIQAAQRRGRIRKGDSRQFAIALSGMMMQLTRDWLRHESHRPLMEQADFVADLFLQGAQQGR